TRARRPPEPAADDAAPDDVALDRASPDDGSGVDRAASGSRRSDRRVGRADGAGRARAPAGLDPDADPVAVAKEICLRLLTDRARTRHELAQALRRKGVPDDAADQVLGRFDEVGLIDDTAFAGQWVRSRHRYRGLGRRAIAAELRRKGVDDEIAGEALAEVDGEAEERRARQLVDKKLRTMALTGPDDRTTAARRLVGMLARKGYGAGVAYGVVRAALAEHGADEELGDEPPPED
ncbi:regulatory protein RecX, partial [Pseudonocardia lacus]|uniref:regulatory protein RecX n=1 Tax=Pseudonocardia lacus TaxID=2835865 RepID=UPI0027E2B76D